MDMATVNARAAMKAGTLDDLDVSEEVNACSIKVTVKTSKGEEPWLVMFKNETHNHPTEIEPYGGAATCVGGIIRDPMSGRAHVYQAMRITGAGDPLEPVADTLPGKLPQRVICRQAAAGYSEYANRIGLAGGLLQELYHPGYRAKRMELGAVVAAAPESYVRRSVPQEGDLVLLIGARTGRDGCGAATGSSKEQDEQSIETGGPEVQKGDAALERRIQRLYRNPDFTRLVKRCNDFGAGGVSVAIGELAPGLDIDLDKVPVKYEGLDGTELAISESQERMAVVIAAESLQRVSELCAAEGLESALVARVADHARVKLSWRGREIVNLSRDFLDTAGADRNIKILLRQPEPIDFFEEEGKRARLAISQYTDSKGAGASVAGTNGAGAKPSLSEAWCKTLASLGQCSQKGLAQMFDSTVGAGTVLMPLGGKNQETLVQAMVAKIPVLDADTETATWMSFGFDPYLSQWSPFHGGLYAVVDALVKLACAGGDPFSSRLTFQEFFPSPGENPGRWGLPMAALLGAQAAMTPFGLPAVGGKDSMSGTYVDIDVPPTLVAFAVSVGDADSAISPEWKKPGSLLVYLPSVTDAQLCPDFDRLKENLRFVTAHRKDIISAYALGSGGLAEAVAKSAFGNDVGAELKPELSESRFFAPGYGSILLELDGDFPLDAIQKAGAKIIGKTTDRPEITLVLEAGDPLKISLAELRKGWSENLEPVYPTRVHSEAATEASTDAVPDSTADAARAAAGLSSGKKARSQSVKSAKPLVVVPLLPGATGEYDLSEAFKAAGASVKTLVFKNLTSSDVQDSYEALASAISQAHIIAIPGGFTLGTDFMGRGKMLETVFRSPRIKEQTELLLDKREGLMLGIGSGFQALVKLGLISTGSIQDRSELDLTLTTNAITRHRSTIVRTRITSVKSPWFAGFTTGDIHYLPLSCGEGRVRADSSVLVSLAAKDQIAARYVDAAGAPSMDAGANPPGSALAIEALSSPDGRILGKMGQDDRVRPGLYLNVPGNYVGSLFENGVRYFS